MVWRREEGGEEKNGTGRKEELTLICSMYIKQPMSMYG